MPNLLTIPIEIRLKILDYAISDLVIKESFIRRIDSTREDDWNYLVNPNVDVHLICRQIRNECDSPQVRKPVLQDEKPRPFTEPGLLSFFHFRLMFGLYTTRQDRLRGIGKMMAQISMLKIGGNDGHSYGTAHARPGSEGNRQTLVQALKDDIRTRLPLDNYEVEVAIEQDEQANSTLITTTVKPRRQAVSH